MEMELVLCSMAVVFLGMEVMVAGLDRHELPRAYMVSGEMVEY